jgi:hypothetical protein
MKNEATKFFKEYFKVHEQDMVMYEDTIDCLVKFAEKVNNPDVSKMAYWYLRSHFKELQNKLRIASDELKRRDASIETTSNNKTHNKQLDNETDAAGNYFSDADSGL